MRPTIRSAAVAAFVAAPIGTLAPQSVAALPRDSVPVPAATGACTRTVPPDGNLQQALRRAQDGDVICLVPGATYEAFVLPQRRDTGWVVVRTASPDSAFALPGVRVRPSAAPALARVIQTSNNAAIRTAPSAAGWRLIGLDVTTNVLSYAIITLGEPNRPQVTLDVVPRKIILDRMFVHGTPTQTVRRCIALNSASTAIVNSWIDDCHEKGADSQAILGWNGPGPYRIENNALAGAGENVMFGGADPSIPGLIPADITIVRNHFFTPLSWKGRWTKKNVFELKSAWRVLVEGNVIEGSWLDGQTGYALVLKSMNQSGKCPWCRTKDVTIQRNLVRNAAGGMNLAGHQTDHPYDVDSVMTRLVIRDNLFEDLNVKGYTGEGRLLQLMGEVEDVVLERNVMVTTGPIQRAISLQKDRSGLRVVMKNNIMSYGQYGMAADDRGVGAPALGALPGAQVSGNVFLVGRNADRGGSSVPGFTYQTRLDLSIVDRATRKAVAEATRGVVVTP